MQSLGGGGDEAGVAEGLEQVGKCRIYPAVFSFFA